jgi:hypothetical protein
MPNPGDWGFYGSYFVIVRVIESIENLTNKTNNRRNNTYFRGALVNLQDNFSIEISDTPVVDAIPESVGLNQVIPESIDIKI